jgi:ribosomal protein S18 acetylase RimI-like enzyme
MGPQNSSGASLPDRLLLDCLFQSSLLCLVAVVRGELIGCLTARLLPGAETYIASLCVAQPFRRQGVAKLLCSSLPVRTGTTSLHCALANGPARELYRQLGFQEQGEVKGFYRSSQAGHRDAMLYAKVV